MPFETELRAIVGQSGLVDQDDIDRFRTDWSGKRVGDRPIAVVRPRSTDEVTGIVRACARHEVAIVTQGGNTGLVGGSVPLGSEHPESRPCIVLSTSRLDRIRSVDVARATMTVEAGVTIQAAQEAAASAGLLFAPDWGARGSAHVGGGISTNAGGLNVLRWGTMREQVLGLEVVLPDGRVLDMLRSLRKDATGLDAKQLFIGTEGTLGIVTAAVIRLHALPSAHRTAFAALTDLDSLMPLFELARSEAATSLSAFELLPHEGLERVLANVASARRPLEEDSEWYVLLRLSGDDDVADTLASLLGSAAEKGLVTDAAIAATADQERNIWLLRDEVPAPFTFDERGNRHKFDIALPIDCVVGFLRDAPRIVDQVVAGALTFAFGHVGDGNLHFNVYPGPGCDVDEFDANPTELVSAVDDLTWSYGGTISAEHGIGQEMRDRLSGQMAQVELELLRSVKNAIDPLGIMNPGKVIPPPRTTTEPTSDSR